MVSEPVQEPLDGTEVPQVERPKKAEWVDVEVTLNVRLSEKEAWDDGVPDPSGFWTAHTLASWVALYYSSPGKFLEEWNLMGELEITFRDDQGRVAYPMQMRI